MNKLALKVLIVDDEELARQKVQRYLSEVTTDVDVKMAANGLEAVSTIKEFMPRIVFLDIQMPGLTGFEVLDHINERCFVTIFQTAYDAFAIKAFEENACDYLLKPYTRERFVKAWQRALQQSMPKAGELDLLQSLTAERCYLKHLCVEQRGVHLLLNVHEVDAFVSRDHYTCLHVGDKEYLMDMSLQRLEERLDPSDFIRTHRSSIVRVAAIRAVSKGEEAEVTLSSGAKISVSRRCRGPLMDRLKGG